MHNVSRLRSSTPHKGALRGVALMATLQQQIPTPGCRGSKATVSRRRPRALPRFQEGWREGSAAGSTANTRRHLPIIPPTIPRIAIRCHGDPLFPAISSHGEGALPALLQIFGRLL